MSRSWQFQPAWGLRQRSEYPKVSWTSLQERRNLSAGTGRARAPQVFRAGSSELSLWPLSGPGDRVHRVCSTPEIIAFLGKSSKLAHVRLLWRPPLLQTGFLLGLGLVLASIGLARRI